MTLTLENVVKTVGAQTHLYPMTLTLHPGLNVLLGPTLAGKTSLMRLMAGLDQPSGGRVLMNGQDVTGVSVQKRSVAFVYQQFVNYPSFSVYENIASPLRIAGLDAGTIRERVNGVAELMHLEPMLKRLPAELSGGQQQRVAIARALVKEAGLLLFDEPLVNLDYKLREELRNELSLLFAAGRSTVVYATTEPTEALLLGGYTAVLDAGELLQYGPTAEVFHRPKSMRVARAFSDPPMNLFAGTAGPNGVTLANGMALALPLPARPSQAVTVGVRAGALRVVAQPGDVALPGQVELAEISGSDTFLHVATAIGELVAQLTGVHQFDLGAAIALHLDPRRVYVFDAAGDLLHAPGRQD